MYPMTESQIARVTLEVLKAMYFLHAQNAPHNSTASKEVCLFDNGSIKLLSPGFAISILCVHNPLVDRRDGAENDDSRAAINGISAPEGRIPDHG